MTGTTAGAFFLGGVAALLLGVTYFGYRRWGTPSVDEFVAAGRNVGAGVLAASVCASWIWTTTILGASEAGLTYGVSGGFHYAWGAALPFIVFLPLALALRRRFPGFSTLPEVIEERFGRPAKYAILLFAVGVAFYVFTEQLIGAGLLMRATFGLSYSGTVIFTASLVVCYITVLGLRGSLVTDIIQYLVVAGVSVAVLPTIAVQLGLTDLFSGLVDAAGDSGHRFYNSEATNWLSLPGARYGLVAAIVATGQVLLDQGYYQRAVAARDSRELGVGYIVGGVLAWAPIPIAFGLVIGAAGMHLASELPVLTTPSEIAPAVVAHVLGPIGALAFALMTFMAATSTADSSLGGIQSIMASARGRTREGSRDGVRFGRRGTVAFGVLGALVALPAENVSLLMYDIFSGILFASPVAALVFGIWSSRIRGVDVIVSIVVGLASGLSLWTLVDDPDLNWFYGNLASLGIPFLILAVAHLWRGRGTPNHLGWEA